MSRLPDVNGEENAVMIEKHKDLDQKRSRVSIMRRLLRPWISSPRWVSAYAFLCLLPVGSNVSFILLMILVTSDRLFTGSGTGNSSTLTTIAVMVIMTILQFAITVGGLWGMLRFSNTQKWSVYLRFSLSTLVMIVVVAIGIATLIGLIILGFFAVVSDNY